MRRTYKLLAVLRKLSNALAPYGFTALWLISRCNNLVLAKDLEIA
jgi:hypothetical protein